MSKLPYLDRGVLREQLGRELDLKPPPKKSKVKRQKSKVKSQKYANQHEASTRAMQNTTSGTVVKASVEGSEEKMVK